MSDDLFQALGVRNISALKATPEFLNSRVVTAYFLISFSVTLAIAFLYATVISKLLPYTGIAVIDFIKDDHYFCYLLPLMILPTYLAIYLNWLASQIFENN